jgi:WD40 repeat protein
VVSHHDAQLKRLPGEARLTDRAGGIVFSLPWPSGVLGRIALTPDGRMIALAGGDGQRGAIRLWQPHTGQLWRLPAAHTAPVTAVAFSADGKHLASGSADHTVRLWDVATGKDLLSLAGHGAAIRCLAFSPDGSLLASGSADGGVKLWDTRTGRERARLAGHAGAVTCLAFCPAGRALASAGSKGFPPRGEINLWDVSRGRLQRELASLSEVLALAFTADGRTVATAQAEVIFGMGFAGVREVLQLWDAAAGAPGPRFPVPEDVPWVRTVYSLAFAADGTTLLYGTRKQTVQSWQTRAAPWHEARLGKDLLLATAWPLPPPPSPSARTGGSRPPWSWTTMSQYSTARMMCASSVLPSWLSTP